MRTLRLTVRLRDVVPPVTRVFDVPRSTTLPELHDLLQAALGWTDCHLHQFIAGERRWGVPSVDSWDADELDECTASLTDLPPVFVYLYDFGDSWEHDIEVLGPGADRIGLVQGEGACPPEDVGGFPGFEHFQTVLADAGHREHEELKAWSEGAYWPFEPGETDKLLRRTAGSVPATVLAFLTVIGDGVKLTQASNLPPAVVAGLVGRIPAWDPHYGSMREDNVPEVWRLKDFLREVGLLRLINGRLLPTKACSDDAEIIRRLRRGFPEDRFETLLVTSALAVLSTGSLTDDELMERVLPTMGRGWTVNGEPLNATALRSAWWGQCALLRALDLLAETPYAKPVVLGPSALTLLPRATGLADLLAKGASV